MIRYFRLSEQSKYTLKDVSRFNDQCFPFRKPNRPYDVYRFVENPFAADKIDSIYCASENGQYIGHLLTMAAPLALNGDIIPAYWGQDLFVRKEHRRRGIGTKFTDYAAKKNYYMGCGISQISKPLYKREEIKTIGHLYFFRKRVNSWNRLKVRLRRKFKIGPKNIFDCKLPDQVNGFKRIKSPTDLHLPKLNWNENVIETLRDRQFFEWRFFYKFNQYFVYQTVKTENENAVYFVAKPYHYQNENWLQLVDYRFDNQNLVEFKTILEAAEKLSKKLKLSGILTNSSQELTNSVLKQNKFTLYKRNMVVSTFPFSHKETDEPHNHFIISRADSDGDMNLPHGVFNYLKYS